MDSHVPDDDVRADRLCRRVPRLTRPSSVLRFLFVLLLALAGSGAATHPASKSKPVVVVISLDGFRHDYPVRIQAQGFSRLELEGVKADRFEPSFPASTFPSLATLATGCHPGRHGILNNHFMDAQRGEFHYQGEPDWLQCEPAWVTAERQGVRAATLNWVGSYGEWRGRGASDHDVRFTKRSDRTSMRKILEWLQRPAGRRPRLIYASLAGADHAGHSFGPGSSQVTRRIGKEDLIIEELLRGLKELEQVPITLLVMTDHGMSPQRGTLNPAKTLNQAGIRHRAFLSGGSGNIYFERPADTSAGAVALRKLVGLEVHFGDRLPPDLHYHSPGRTGDLVLVAPPGVALGRLGTVKKKLEGVHGYRGTEPEMGGIFYAWGHRIRAGGRVSRVRAVDLYSLVCELLEIKPSPQAQGSIPREVLTVH